MREVGEFRRGLTLFVGRRLGISSRVQNRTVLQRMAGQEAFRRALITRPILWTSKTERPSTV